MTAPTAAERNNTPSWRQLCHLAEGRPEVGDAATRVARGANLLDRECPGWRDTVDPRELRTSLGYPGILGILWPEDNRSGDTTSVGLAALRIRSGEAWFGFWPLRGESRQALDEAWIAEIRRTGGAS